MRLKQYGSEQDSKDIRQTRSGVEGHAGKLVAGEFNNVDPGSNSSGRQQVEPGNVCEAQSHSENQASPPQPPLAWRDLVDRFLAWPLPKSVCSDSCVTEQNYPHRTGTNLLTADEAKEMFEYCGALHNGKTAPEWESLLKLAIKDDCETDTNIRNLARPLLGEKLTDHDGYAVIPLEDVVEALIKQLRDSAPRWIPIEEKPPSGSNEVLFWDGETVDTFIPDTGTDAIHQSEARCKQFGVKAWMLLPLPPFEKKDESEEEFEKLWAKCVQNGVSMASRYQVRELFFAALAFAAKQKDFS